MIKPRRQSERGFALLLVFAMASIVAIALYYSMPRVAFEAQRDKEQTLIDRGEQYQRAIQLYVRKNKRWPAKIEDLESSNSIRYLRRRYVDPMTGKADWTTDPDEPDDSPDPQQPGIKAAHSASAETARYCDGGMPAAVFTCTKGALRMAGFRLWIRFFSSPVRVSSTCMPR